MLRQLTPTEIRNRQARGLGSDHFVWVKEPPYRPYGIVPRPKHQKRRQNKRGAGWRSHAAWLAAATVAVYVCIVSLTNPL